MVLCFRNSKCHCWSRTRNPWRLHTNFCRFSCQSA